MNPQNTTPMNHPALLPLAATGRAATDIRAAVACDQMRDILKDLRERSLPGRVVDRVNLLVADMNDAIAADHVDRKRMERNVRQLLRLLEKEVELVPRNHHSNLWRGLGIAVFGVPLGLAVGSSVGEIGLVGLGLPVGVVFGTAVGILLDRKAHREGRQLDVEMLD